MLDCEADNVRLDYYCNYRITVSPQDKKTKKTADKLLATFTKHQHSWQILILKPLFVLYIRCLCLSFVCIRIAVHNQVMNPTWGYCWWPWGGTRWSWRCCVWLGQPAPASSPHRWLPGCCHSALPLSPESARRILAAGGSLRKHANITQTQTCQHRKPSMRPNKTNTDRDTREWGYTMRSS